MFWLLSEQPRVQLVATRPGSLTAKPQAPSNSPPPLAFDPQQRPCMAAVRDAGDALILCHAAGSWHGWDRDDVAIPGISATPRDAFSPELVASADGRVELAWMEVAGYNRHAYTRQLVGARGSRATPATRPARASRVTRRVGRR